MEIVVPVVNGVQKAHRGDDGLRHGAHDGDQGAQVARAVDAGGFLHALGQPLKVVLHDKHIELHNCKRQDAGGVCIQQAQAAHHHVRGNHTTEEHHADDIQQCDDPAPFEIGLRQGIGSGDGGEQTKRRTHRRDDEGVFQGRKKRRFGEHIGERLQLKAHGPEIHIAGGDVRPAADSLANYVQTGKDGDKTQ